ncbi:MAG: zf-HC2 domain-containing protein [Nakamurella sp.]
MTLPSSLPAAMFEAHLGLDAVVAFSDGELGLTAFGRAAAHVSRCAQCAREVDEQEFARRALRSAACPSIPSALMASLLSIPIALPAASKPPRGR